MKKNWMLIGNIAIVLAILALILFYVRSEQEKMLVSETEAFGNMTVAMESVTTNYLIGEQQVCNSWANYLNANDLIVEDAIAFVRDSIISPEIMAHILFSESDGFAGISTTARAGTTSFDVSYKNIAAFGNDLEKLLERNGTVRVTRAYTNPTNAIQSIAFCNEITVRRSADASPERAVLLRIVPVSSLEKKWTFPTEDYQSAELSLIDTAGNYILRGHSFKNSNFFEFYRSYNSPTSSELDRVTANIDGDSGVLTMRNSSGTDSLVAHTRINSTDDWVLVTMIGMDALGYREVSWTLAGIIALGLLLLLIFNLFSMQQFNRELRAAAVAADRANQAKTDFLSTMSHDIRTPMNAIIGLTTIAAKNVEDTAAVRENLRKISLASNHLLTLINDILDISKVESGKLTLSPVTFSIVECAENLVNISQPMVKAKDIDFNFRVSRFEHEYLFADQLRINQIYINLLSNAIKYTEPGGRVCVELHETESENGKSAKITYIVADTGMGMTPEFMARMYQPFSRQTDSRVNKTQGTGLGLAITKQMIDLMGGTIDCKSEVGKGTTFTVTLDIPLADKLTDDLLLPQIRVLLVDDDEVLLETAKDTLKSIGVQADTVQSGEDAVRAVQANGPYRVVILDWKMPDMDGIEAAKRIRAAVGNDVPILLISAYDWSDIEDVAKAAGVNGFISKPLFRTTLYDKLNELLGSEEKRDTEDNTTDLEGMRILIAEDNDVNWEIISMLLGMQGIETERAENGKVAVERMQSAPDGAYALIFMDVQMPVMNGIEATKAIRRLDNPWAASIPIIAMTADAFSENVAECLAAGMNGHIAKPIDMKLVMKEIKQIKEESKA